MSFVNHMKAAALNDTQPEANENPPTESTDSSTADLSNVQVLIQTTRDDDETILTRDQLLLHVNVLTNLSQLSVELFGA